ncbi:glycosyltransferase family 39 protein [Mucilaginibacter yixingensis]|nr:glycosyltransferase family 39 protein [Mucilaginibacter yixingensis]
MQIKSEHTQLMQDIALNNHKASDKPIWYFLLLWTILNIIQAATLEVHPDEAYYWLYSRFMDWGYFDHPPMVAIFIRVGDAIMHNELGLRLVTVLVSPLSIWLLWQTLKPYAVSAKWFILVVSGLVILHMYGFTTTPDAPLFFFTALFYYIYQRYVEHDKMKWALLLALIIAGLLYSKYHGILLIGFTVLSNIKLLKRPSFWLIVVLSAVLFMPHVWWQMQHQYPSLRYHLYERSSSGYDVSRTLLYLPGQFVMAGPLIGWFLFGFTVTTKIKDAFIRCLMVNFIGTIAFFMLSTIKDDVQSHWTLIGFAPLILLVMIRFSQTQYQPRWLMRLAVVNAALIVLLRIGLMVGVPFIKQSSRFQSYYGYKQWAQQVKQRVGNSYVVFISGFQDASKYCYYTNSTKGFDYDAREYRRTQFDIWPIEDSLQHKRTYYLLDFHAQGSFQLDSFKTARGQWYGTWLNDTRMYQKVDIQADKGKVKAAPGQKIVFNLTVNNPYNHTISFKNEGYPHELVMAACFLQGDQNTGGEQAGDDFNRITLKPGQTAPYRFVVAAPKTKGKYVLVFSIRTTPFPGGRNSRAIDFTVE